jgi:FkbM family methyltransferase
MAVLLCFLKAELVNKILNHAFLFRHDLGPTFLVDRGFHSARLHYFLGVQDFDDELFALHYVRDGDWCLDIGANIGIYSLLLACASGARVIAVEPSRKSADMMRMHIAINNLSDRITLLEACVGDQEGVAAIKNSVDMDNFVVPGTAVASDGMVMVPMHRIDDLVLKQTPRFMKIDVEGFEMQALQGASRLLGNTELRAIVIETNGLTSRFGFSVNDIHAHITQFGFTAVRYDALFRKLMAVSKPNTGEDINATNTLYVRDVAEAQERLSGAPRRKLLGLEI